MANDEDRKDEDVRVIDDQEMEEAADEADPEETAGLGEIEPTVPAREQFLNFLRSPVVELVVGTGANENVLSAHQTLLTKSPFFAAKCAEFDESTIVRRVELPDDDLDAVGSFLEYLYKGEYFPKRLSEAKDSGLEPDSTTPQPDEAGLALLRHARIYNMAEKFGVPALKSLAHSKIHRTASTAKGEISYARFVYKETSKEDPTLRKPIAAFWAAKSHTLRHEAEVEFRTMCLEYPQFAFDVLTLVLDQKERREPVVHAGPLPGSSRKRARQT